MSQPGGRTSSSCTPCNYKDAWSTIRSRGIEAAPTKLLRAVDLQPVVEGQTATPKSMMKGFLGLGDGGSPELEKALTELFNVMDTAYKTEELFSQELFNKIADCFRQSGWEVTCRESRKTGISAPRVKRIPLRPRKDVIGEEEAEKGQRVVLESMIFLGRKEAARSSSQHSAAGVTTEWLEKYVVQVGDWEYAMGLSRKVHMPGNESSIFSGESFPDHALALFKKKVEISAADEANDAAKKSAKKSANKSGKRKAKNEWIVDQILAAVELKMSDTACRRFDVESTKRSLGSDEASERVRVQCFRESNDARYGPLGQELAYVFGHVLWGRAALGLEIERSLPMAVVAGKRIGEASPKDALCWFHGNLLVPEECGGKFRFNVDAIGGFDEDGRRASGMEALAVYANVMMNGRSAAQDWLKSHATLRPPVPMCGRTLRFGSEDLSGMRLELSPVTKGDDRVDVPDDDSTPAVNTAPKISQGELFAGEVDMARLRNGNPESKAISWCNDASEGFNSNKVMVKVSSRACYNSLVGREGLVWNHKRMAAWSQVRRLLSQSLFGVYSTALGYGLVQVMPDLTHQGFELLCPESLKDDNQWNSMWHAFKAFVDKILIPLAEADVIHPDLRPGYNCTANLLYNRTAKEMRMIDLDSLVLFTTWSQSNPGDDRYIVDRSDGFQGELLSAHDFVFKQVVVITGAWIREVQDGEADADAIFEESEIGRAWNPDCRGDDIRRVLEAIEPHFEA